MKNTVLPNSSQLHPPSLSGPVRLHSLQLAASTLRNQGLRRESSASVSSNPAVCISRVRALLCPSEKYIHVAQSPYSLPTCLAEIQSYQIHCSLSKHVPAGQRWQVRLKLSEEGDPELEFAVTCRKVHPQLHPQIFKWSQNNEIWNHFHR